ncbi:hypothetical protein C1I92_07130 [Jiangella anatolica]|uniref:HTH araC/xylS-type domain-containing protein n=2 Tax=Jiangella anatolica TaxID=2670374 RepID=A0A2W2BB77_9ACTN|nr:hypothetical protein C1I92_07130 [Jiangella anatolica]
MTHPAVTLDGSLFAVGRERFSRAADAYEGWCLLTAQTGSFRFSIEGAGDGRCEFGDVVIAPPHAVLRRELLTPSSFFWARFHTGLDLPAGRTPVADVARLAADLRRLRAAHLPAERGPHALDAGLVTTHLVSDIVLLVLSERADAAGSDDPLIERAVAHLRRHFADPDLSLRRLAQHLHLSPAQLTRRFRAARATTPVAFLRTVRLQHAQRLLVETDDTLQAIAERSGYRSAYYLSRVFSAHLGQSPSQYRRRHRV